MNQIVFFAREKKPKLRNICWALCMGFKLQSHQMYYHPCVYFNSPISQNHWPEVDGKVDAGLCQAVGRDGEKDK